ncbi:MAG: cadherin domain-containing protein, partial [Thiofilum sp.]
MVILVLTNMSLLAPTAQAALVPNVTTPWLGVTSSTARSPNFLCTGLTCPTISNVGNVTDASLTNYASITFPILSVLSYAEVGVKQAGTTYPAGHYAGFRIEKVGGLWDTSLFNNITITTYLSGVAQENLAGTNLIDGTFMAIIGASNGGAFNTGFWTTKAFDEVRIRVSQPIGISIGGEIRIYHGVVELAAPSTTPIACNGGNGTPWTKPTYPVRLENSRTGVQGLCAGCKVEAASNLLDSNYSDYSNVYIAAGLLGTGSVSVIDPLSSPQPAGTFAGFSINDAGGLAGAFLDIYTLTSYLNGVPQETRSVGSLFDWPIFSGRHVVGFHTTKPFNEIRVSAGSITGVNTDLKIYNVVLAPASCFVTNNPPVITSNGGGDSAAINIPENTTAVTTVTATDADNDTLTYSISGGVDSNKFTINSSTGVLTFVTAPNFENPTDTGANNVYDLQVQVSDGNGGTDIQNLAITITNSNEAPIITSNGGGISASISIPENTSAVTTVTAIDPDNDTLTYSISGGSDASKLSINSSTGVLTFITAPDFENPTDVGADNIYNVTVQASDGKGGIDTQNLSITITNLSENQPPVITSNGGGVTASISIPEKTTAVTIVTATDPDADTITFSIIGGADAAKLTIDSATGVLRFITAPNYGSTLLGSLLGAPGDANGDNIYEVTVQASDGKGGTDTQALSITVTKVLINLRLQIKAFLQGSYDESTTLMGDGLRAKGLIPTLQPYTNLVGSLGLESISSSLLSITGNNAPVDWVLVELRSPLNPNQILLSIPSILQRDGDVVDPVTGNLLSLNTVALGSYYLAIRHRNHLGIRTKNTVSLLDAINVIDFTKGVLSQNEGILTKSGDIQLWAGDANVDNQVIANGPNNDTSLVLSNVLLAPANTSLNSNYINAGYAKADLNLDGDVIFAGPNNDVNVIVFNVIMHPANSTRSQNYIVNGSL